MITWTPEAERVIYTYLNEVSRLAVLRGEDGEELQASLMEHLRSEVAAKGWDMVTEEQAQQLVHQLGSPEAVVGEQSAPSAPAPQAPPRPPKPRSRTGCIVGIIAALLIAFSVPVLATLAYFGAFQARPYVVKILAVDPEEEGKVVEALRTIASLEKQFREERVVDKNNDGDGDYGTLQELAAWSEETTVPIIVETYEITLTVTYGDESTAPGYTCTATSIDQERRHAFYLDETLIVRFTDDETVPNEHSKHLEMLQIDAE